MARITKKPEDRKNEILDAAQALFADYGYHQTSVTDIVKQVGVAQGTFYYYFKSKNEIVDAIVERHLNRMLEPFEKLSRHTELSAKQKIQRLLAHEFGERQEHEQIVDYLHNEKNAVIHQKLIVRSVKRFAPLMAMIIEQGNREGVFHTISTIPLAEFMLSGLQFWLDTAIFGWTKEERSERVKVVGSLLETVLGAEKGSFDHL